MGKREVVTPEWFYQGSTVLKAFRFPIKDFRYDEKRSPRSERDGLESFRGELAG